MKSSTKMREQEQRMLKEWQEPNIYQMTGMSKEHLEEMGKKSGALVRKRKIQEGQGLLRMAMVYVATDWSLRLVAQWAKLKEIGDLSDVGVLYRLKQCVAFLGMIIVELLAEQNEELKEMKGVRANLQDGMVVSRPGSKGTDWRYNIRMDLGKMCLTGASLNDYHVAEGLQHFEVDPEEIVIGDRGHAVARGIGWILSKQGLLVVRIGWTSLKLRDETGKGIGLIAWLNGLEESSERMVQLETPAGTFSLRLIACKLPEEKAEEARERVRQRAKKDGKKANPNSLVAAGFVMLITNLPLANWSLERVAWLYRLRWQIELQFKRLKSLLHFDHLRAQDEQLAQVYLLGKLLLALLMDQMTLEAQDENPELFADTQRPISYWRLFHLLWFCLCQRIVGPLPAQWILSEISDCRRYLCEPPRKRPQQAALARQAMADPTLMPA